MNQSPPPPAIKDFPEEEIDNNDMNMDPTTLARMEAHVRAAMSEPRIKQAFDHYEAKANLHKKWHTWVGTISLVLLIIALSFGLLRLWAHQYGFADVLEPFVAVAVVAGSIPFLCAAALRVFHVHEHWVISRFRAERIRHWKFHQLLDGDYIQRLNVQSAADFVFNEQWDNLQDELKAGVDQMDEYVQSKPFSSPFMYDPSEDHTYSQPEVFRGAARVFFNARLRFQRKWFVRESKRYQKSDLWTKRTAGWLLVFSVAAAFGEGVLHFFGPVPVREHCALGVTAFGVLLALFSAGFRVYRSASGLSENAERYQRMSNQILWYEARYTQLLRKKVHDEPNQKELLNMMEAIERLCHGEMVEFVRIALKSDYLF